MVVAIIGVAAAAAAAVDGAAVDAATVDTIERERERKVFACTQVAGE